MVRRKSKRVKVEKAILDAYTNLNNHTSFSSPQIIYDHLKRRYKNLKFSKVNNILKGVDSYTLYKNVKNKHLRGKVIAVGKFTHLQMDLADMSRYSSTNNNYKYILFVIDVFTRVLDCQIIKKKDTISVLRAFKLFAHKYRKYFSDTRTLSSDLGGEFKSKHFASYLKKLNIYQQFLINTKTKGAFVERSIFEVKKKLQRYLFQNNTFKYIQILPQIVKNYNNSYNRILKMTPLEALKSKESKLWCQLYLPKVKKVIKNRPFKFKVNDTVRISSDKGIFKKVGDQNYTEEIFKIKKRYRISNICYYQISDLNNKDIIGSFVNSELTRIPYDKDAFFPIDKVHQRKGSRYLVSFRGYPGYYWVSDIKDI